jgi:rubrerythrin
MQTILQEKTGFLNSKDKIHSSHCFTLGLDHSLQYSDNHLIKIDCQSLTTQQTNDLANCLPFLACGEESAVHAFSSSLLKHVTIEEQVEMNAIAEDELRHAMWLTSLKNALPEPSLTLPQDAMTRFFKRLLTKKPALHFARVAALDYSVCKILVPLIRENAGLQLAPQVKEGLISIMKDEARHVQIAKNMAIKLGMNAAELEHVNAQIHQELMQLLKPITPCLKRLAEHQTVMA